MIEKTQAKPGSESRELTARVSGPEVSLERQAPGVTSELDEVTAGALTQAWTIVVKEGRRLKHVPQSATDQCVPARKEKRKMGITGTSNVCAIKTVTSKLVSVFATRFDPALDADILRGYLVEKLQNQTVVCRKIAPTQGRYSSFHVTAECNDVGCVYDPDLWPAGIYVRHYYNARRAGGIHGQCGAMRDTPPTIVEPSAAVDSSLDHA